MDKKVIQKAIETKLQETQNCKFKKAWIPKGWACVHISTFMKEMAELIISLDNKSEKS